MIIRNQLNLAKVMGKRNQGLIEVVVRENSFSRVARHRFLVAVVIGSFEHDALWGIGIQLRVRDWFGTMQRRK
jgi:hypothetical protein